MISAVLIANRGEIAVRIARTLGDLGVESVGVYSAVDAGMPHTRAVDRAIALPGDGAIAPYLDVEAILLAARESGVDAVHPGYGFLAESAAAAAAVERAGLAWIGPGPEAIELLGDKARSKRVAEEAGVPVVPGLAEQPATADTVAGADEITAERVRAFAAEHGYPVMIKAGAGGGGKGMRRVDADDQVDAALGAARREAVAAFGAGHLLVEKLIEPARHIEVQVALDSDGGALALGERECSLQRRHQKLTEESPSPAVTAESRRKLCRAALDLAAAASYRNLGTVEFLVDAADPDRFYFLEMNARLQVEHPVTEAVTGLDLVAMQLAIANDEPVAAFAAADGDHVAGYPLAGRHAIEARICAERPAEDFLPATGTVLVYREPADARVDSGIETGIEITADFDPMLAKVIVADEDRERARRALIEALEETVVLGVETNTAFLAWLLDRPEVRDGAITIAMVEQLLAAGAYEPAVESGRAALLEAAAIALAIDAGTPPTAGTGFGRYDGWRLGGVPGTGHWTLRDDAGRTHEVTARPGDGDAPTGIEFVVTADEVAVHRRGAGSARFRFVREGEQQAGAERGGLEAALPGTVLELRVAPGDRVAAGQVVLTVESMKMELELAAPAEGVVAEIAVAPGEHVERGQTLAVVE